MLKQSPTQLAKLEVDYPGITQSILKFDESPLPHCPSCRSENTAHVKIGCIGRTMAIAAATTKVKLIPNNTTPSNHYCNSCTTFFLKETEL
mgnify:CR=1 FL=1